MRLEKELKMTREEAFNIYEVVGSEIIDEIYDDFEIRTCENCKYANQTSYALYCRKGIKSLILGVDKDFGCNKFERKTNED